MKKKKSKGFTLVELLVTIAILAILVSVGIGGYLIYNKQAKEYAYELSRDSLLSSASLYYQENQLEPVATIDNKNYYCITVQELINKGYHKAEEIENIDRITPDTYIKITENAKSHSKEKQELLSNDTIDICNVASQTLEAKTKDVFSNKIISEIKKLNFYDNYTCYYKTASEAYIKGKYQDAEGKYGYCHFENLTPNTKYTYKACATATLNSKEYEACSEEINATTKEINTPKIIEYSYFISNKEYKKSDGYDFNVWSNDKIINISYDYNNLDSKTTYLMFYINSTNSVKSTSHDLLKCNNETCQSSSTIKKNNLLQTGWYALKIDENSNKNMEVSLRINKSNVEIKAKIYDGTNNSNTSKYTTSKIDNIKPNISDISQATTVSSDKKQSLINITTIDNESGIDKIYISKSNNKPDIDDKGWVTLSSNTYQTYLTIGTTYYMWVMDKVQNISTIKSYTVKNPDKTPPTISYSVSTTDCDYKSGSKCWSKDSKKVKITLSDNVSLKNYKIYRTDNNSTKASKEYTQTKTTDSFTVDLNNYNYTIKACDTSDNCSTKQIYKSQLYIDDTAPTLDDSDWDYSCDGGVYYEHWIETSDTGTGYVKAYQNFTSSSRTPTSGWKSFTDYVELDCGEVYYIHIKLVDGVGNVSYHNLGGFLCDDCDSGYEPEPDPEPSNDCKIVCMMNKNSYDWNFQLPQSDNRTKLHALNSILAGKLSFSSQITYNPRQGTWYKGGTKLYTWYNNNCGGTTCSKPSWSTYAKKTYSFYAISGYDTCTEYNSSYVSGSCGNKLCDCCPMGTGFYSGSCYRDY